MPKTYHEQAADLTDIATALSEIVNDANRASAIIAQIRAHSKKALPEMVVLEVKDLVTEILPLVRHELNARRIVLKAVLADNLDPVMGDRIQLQQVLLNLVINGMEAMHETSRKKTADIFLSRRSPMSRRARCSF